jgi:hypothetical protein
MKTLGNWPRVNRVLEEALARDDADRQAYLAQACGTDHALRELVELLLAAGDRAGPFMETPAALLLAEPHIREDLSAGAHVGAYTLLSPIGRGGMGTVWLAERSDGRFTGRVAVKLLNGCTDWACRRRAVQARGHHPRATHTPQRRSPRRRRGHVRRALGRGDTETAGTLMNNWAFAFNGMGQLLEAEPLYRRAIAISSADGTDDAVSPMLLNNLARTLVTTSATAAALR